MLIHAKTAAMNLMFLADKAQEEAEKEADTLKIMQAPSHDGAATFDSRASQRRVWVAKRELALQVIFELEPNLTGSADAQRTSVSKLPRNRM